MANQLDDRPQYIYKVGLRARHPTLDIGKLFVPIGIAPNNNRVAGEQRISAKGDMLQGKYQESFWNWRIIVKGDMDFLLAVRKLTEMLTPHRDLLVSVTESGGLVAASFALSGLENAGSSLSFQDMRRLVDLKMDLEIEIFPDIRNFR